MKITDYVEYFSVDPASAVQYSDFLLPSWSQKIWRTGGFILRFGLPYERQGAFRPG